MTAAEAYSDSPFETSEEETSKKSSGKSTGKPASSSIGSAPPKRGKPPQPKNTTMTQAEAYSDSPFETSEDEPSRRSSKVSAASKRSAAKSEASRSSRTTPHSSTKSASADSLNSQPRRGKPPPPKSQTMTAAEAYSDSPFETSEEESASKAQGSSGKSARSRPSERSSRSSRTSEGPPVRGKPPGPKKAPAQMTAAEAYSDSPFETSEDVSQESSAKRLKSSLKSSKSSRDSQKRAHFQMGKADAYSDSPFETSEDESAHTSGRQSMRSAKASASAARKRTESQAAAKIQARYRGNRARAEFKEKKRRHKAAQRIQARARGNRDRKHAERLKVTTARERLKTAAPMLASKLKKTIAPPPKAALNPLELLLDKALQEVPEPPGAEATALSRSLLADLEVTAVKAADERLHAARAKTWQVTQDLKRRTAQCEKASKALRGLNTQMCIRCLEDEVIQEAAIDHVLRFLTLMKQKASAAELVHHAERVARQLVHVDVEVPGARI